MEQLMTPPAFLAILGVVVAVAGTAAGFAWKAARAVSNGPGKAYGKANRAAIDKIDTRTEDQERRLRGIEIGRAGCLARLQAMEEKIGANTMTLRDNAEKLDQVLLGIRKLNGGGK